LMFRPFFIDANGVFALVASLENAILAAMLLYVLRNFNDALQLFRSVFFLKFVIIFASVLALLLAAVYYNVGLGLRQRTMYVPALLCFFVSLLAYRQRFRVAQLSPSELPA
jgi:multisubunit Na+/H+ antiporter MnhG subunit